MTNQKTLSPAQIRLLIEEEINSDESLRASNKALYELAGLIDNDRYTLDRTAISHLIKLLGSNINTSLNNIERLTEQLGAS